MRKFIILAAISLGALGCKKELNVGNPNSPTVAGNVNSQQGMISLAQGAVYENGFSNANAYNWLGSSYFSIAYGYSELCADMLASSDANELISQINVPSYVILDDGTKYPPAPNTPQTSTLRTDNTRSSTASGYNPTFYQWTCMYELNGACNQVLSLIGTIKYSGDTATVANTLRAWCYFWKGYAYSSIGLMYYSGIINNEVNTTNNNYEIKDSIIAESDRWLGLAASTLALIPSGSQDYSTVLGALIPSFCQVGNGGILTPAMWTRNINTMLARNLLESKLAPFVNGNLNATITGSSMGVMGNADWQQVLSLASNGIQAGDYVFTGRTVNANGFFSASSGTPAAMATGPFSNTVFTVSMRFTQAFGAGDQRLTNDFDTNYAVPFLAEYSGTYYNLVNGGNGASGVYVYGNQNVGEYELIIAGSYEENQLMLAEANIRLGNVSTALPLIDAVRAYQGSGVAPLAGQNLTAAQAYQALVNERHVALFSRGLSFYDARRWGWTYDISKGGGSYGNQFLTVADVLNTNVTIDYDFMDFWDVPADETQLNPPSSSSAPVQNPNF